MFALAVFSGALVVCAGLPPVQIPPDEVRISGKIILPEKPYPNSHLFVELRDITRMDAPSPLMAKMEVSLNEYEEGNPIPYEFQFAKDRMTDGQRVGVSAIVNMGWEPVDRYNIHSGDLATTRTHSFVYAPPKNDYEVDLQLARLLPARL